MNCHVPLISAATHAMIIDTGATERSIRCTSRMDEKHVCTQFRFGKEVAYVLHTESDHESECRFAMIGVLVAFILTFLGFWNFPFSFLPVDQSDVNLPLMVRYLRERPVALV